MDFQPPDPPEPDYDAMWDAWFDQQEKNGYAVISRTDWHARLNEAARDGYAEGRNDEREEADADARRYRWLREQHEGCEPLSFDADGLPMPLVPTALAFTVFRPERGSLEPVGCIPGELDESIDTAMKEGDNHV